MNRKFVYLIFCFLTLLQVRSNAQIFDWAKNIGSTMMSQVQSLETDADGNSYIAANITGSMTLGSNTINLSGPALLVAKLDAAGNFIWSNVVEGSVYTNSLALDQDNNVFITGALYGTSFDFDNITVSSASQQKYYIAKFDTAGNVAWVNYEDGIFSSRVSADNQGNSVVSLTFYGTRDINGVSYTSTQNGNNPSMFHLQYDSTGAFQWIDQIDLTGPVGWGNFFVQGMASDNSGNSYTVGMFSSGSIVHGTDTLAYGNDSADLFFIKYDQLGNYQWTELGIGVGTQAASGIKVGPSGNIFIAGNVSDSTSFGGVQLITGSSKIGYFVAKFDSQGNGLWGSVQSGTNNIYSSELAVNQLGESFLTGYYNAPFTIAGQTLTTPSVNQNNTFIVKHDASGSPAWSQKAGDGPSGITLGIDISNGSAGDVYLAAFAYDGANFGSTTISNLSGQDWGTIARLIDTTYIPPFPTDSIWPGDANYDLVANNFDLLALGIGYGNTGPTRANASINWLAQPGYDWTQSLASGVNYKHLDCNGDGIINDQDTAAISQNYGLVHNKTDIIEQMGPLLYTEFLVDSAFVGDTVEMAIKLGNDSMPANMIYGLAFTINLDTSLIDPTSVKVSYDSSWFGTLGVDMLAMHRNFPVDGQLEMAITGIDQIDRSGYGEIARISIIMIDDITAKKYFTKSLKATITNHYVIDYQEITQPVAIGQDSITLLQEDTTGTNTTAISPELANKVSIYPNPAIDQLTIQLNDMTAEGYALRDHLGRIIYHTKKRFSKETISLTGLSSGLYFVVVETEKGQVIKKVFKD